MIEDCLLSTGYHPSCAESLEEKTDNLLASLRSNTSREAVEAGLQQVRSLYNDIVLMKGKYFSARVNFLSRLVQYLETRPEENIKVADYGCGTGVDLYVLNTLIGHKLSLTGIEINESSLSIARQRTPNMRFSKDFSDGPFDVIYSDFYSLGDNNVCRIATSGSKNFDALRSPGVVFHNADMAQMSLYLRFFGASFSRIITPELLAEIDGAPNSYFCRFEKD